MNSRVNTLVEETDEQEGGGRLRLLVFTPENVSSHPLPESGELVIGRIESADVRIDFPAISRKHAIIRLGSGVQVEDLGSSNGTRVRGQLLRPGESARVSPGDPVELGSVTLIFQRVTNATASGRPRRLWTHSYFEARLEEECVRASQTNAPFGLVRIKLEGQASPSVVQEVLAHALRPTDLIATYGPGEYELLLIDCDAAKAKALLEQISSELTARNAPVRMALACFPGDGRDPESLIAKACAEVRGDPAPAPDGNAIVVVDPQMQRLHQLVQRIAAGNISVILMGETGVGKEVFAEAVHRHSARASKPFLRLNCAAFTESLLESELFGHEKGAFTGAVKAKVGLLESAQGGTVLLDEVGELPLSVQAKLLRVLEQREVLRVGDLRPRPIDVRFIAATNRDLEAESKKGTFRADLFFRLNGVSLVIPPLRERVPEIEGLARAFIAQACHQAQRPEVALAPEALELLQRYPWPGNIRELRNVIERAVLLCPDRTITLEHLPVEKMSATLLSPEAAPALPAPPNVRPVASEDTESTAVSRDAGFQAERKRILDALEKSAGNQTVAAKLLGISRRTLLVRLDTYAIPRPRKGVPSS